MPHTQAGTHCYGINVLHETMLSVTEKWNNKEGNLRQRPFGAGSQSLVGDREFHVRLGIARRTGLRCWAGALQLLLLLRMTYTTGWRWWRAGHCRTNSPNTLPTCTGSTARVVARVQSMETVNSSTHAILLATVRCSLLKTQQQPKFVCLKRSMSVCKLQSIHCVWIKSGLGICVKLMLPLI